MTTRHKYKFKVNQRVLATTPTGKESVTIKARFLVNYGVDNLPNKNPVYFVWFDDSYDHPKYSMRVAGATFVEEMLSPEVA